MKKCCKCKRLLTVDNFHKKTCAIDGLQPECKSCKKSWVTKNKEKWANNALTRIGYVYVIEAGKTGLVKIGFTTTSPKHRLEELQTGSSESLSLLHFAKGTESDEKALHRVYEKRRVTGEWFDFKGLKLLASLREKGQMFNEVLSYKELG
jgi:Meiotically up-regulated gene 113